MSTEEECEEMRARGGERTELAGPCESRGGHRLFLQVRWEPRRALSRVGGRGLTRKFRDSCCCQGKLGWGGGVGAAESRGRAHPQPFLLPVHSAGTAAVWPLLPSFTLLPITQQTMSTPVLKTPHTSPALMSRGPFRSLHSDSPLGLPFPLASWPPFLPCVVLSHPGAKEDSCGIFPSSLLGRDPSIGLPGPTDAPQGTNPILLPTPPPPGSASSLLSTSLALTRLTFSPLSHHLLSGLRAGLSSQTLSPPLYPSFPVQAAAGRPPPPGSLP